MGNLDLLKARGVSRRDFMKLMAATTAALGLPAAVAPQVTKAVEEGLKKPPVIWLHGMECTGCTTSTLSTIKPSVAEVVLDMLSFRYQETIMAGTGDVAEKALEEALKEKDFILIVEGSIPLREGRYCMVGGKAISDTVVEAAEKAGVIIAAGSCATDGAGIPGACKDIQAVGVRELLKDRGINKPVINLPCCPVKPATLIGTIVYYLTYKKAPELDTQARPVAYYGNLLHDNCPRRGRFENGEFLRDWNDPAQKDYCLLLRGCKGPKTYTDCAQVWWNDNANFCINAGSPCSGCSETGFYAQFSPLYTKQENFTLPGIGQIHPDTIGKVLGGVTAAGVAVHVGAAAASGRFKQEEHGHGEDK